LKLFELGEKGIVPVLTRNLYSRGFITLPAGVDDAAAIRHLGEEIVFTSDIMFASTHFPEAMKPEEMGWKAAVANVSDLAGMGAQPLALLAAFGLPASLELDFVAAISKGINEACKAHECAFAGGDTKKAAELTICGSAIGVCRSEAGLLKRANARPGDIVCVTGNLGDAACGAHILLKRMRSRIPPETASRLVRAFTYPRARVKLGMALSSLGAHIAGMDITDGLFYSCNEIASVSGCGIRIREKLIPFTEDARQFAREQLNASPIRLLEWGEDYELLLTLRRKDFPRAQKAVQAAGGRLIRIGEVIKEKTVYLDDEKVDTKGYDAFLKM